MGAARFEGVDILDSLGQIMELHRHSISGNLYLDFLNGFSQSCRPTVRSPLLCGLAFRKPICSKQNGLHGEGHRLFQQQTLVLHDTLEWLYKYVVVLLLKGIPPLYFVQFF